MITIKFYSDNNFALFVSELEKLAKDEVYLLDSIRLEVKIDIVLKEKIEDFIPLYGGEILK